MPIGLLPKIKEELIAVLPIVFLVLILAATPVVNFTDVELITFAVSAVCLIVGIALFNLGADIAMTPMGEQVGLGLTKPKNVRWLPWVALIMGILITIAEPDLSVLANQVGAVINSTLLIVTVGVGVGVFLLLAMLKILFKKDLSSLLLFFYMTLFAVAALLLACGKGDFLPLAFDSGGVTTGPITVPFIMALGVGVAASAGGKDDKQNSFGLIALCSIGPMLAVMLLSLFSRGGLQYEIPDYSVESHLGAALWTTLGDVALDVLKALGMMVAFFGLLQVTVLHLPRKRIAKLAVGIAFTFVGLVVFLTAVTVGFMPIGYKLGVQLAEYSPILLTLLGVVIGMLVVIAEPAVYVLNRQVERVTSGAVTKRAMVIALSIGVGLAIGLSMLRIVLGFSILFYLIPGYLLALGLSFFVPKLYTAIAFDSGGVASGPLTSSFVLPLAVGACSALAGEESVLSLAFGVVAMVAMAPLITIQLLGFRAIVVKKVRENNAINRIVDADDEQIIDFM